MGKGWLGVGFFLFFCIDRGLGSSTALDSSGSKRHQQIWPPSRYACFNIDSGRDGSAGERVRDEPAACSRAAGGPRRTAGGSGPAVWQKTEHRPSTRAPGWPASATRPADEAWARQLGPAGCWTHHQRQAKRHDQLLRTLYGRALLACAPRSARFNSGVAKRKSERHGSS